MVLHKFFLTILQKSKLVHMIVLPLEKEFASHNVIIHIKSFFNKDENNYYYNIFLQKGLYQLPKTNDNK